MFFKKKSKIEDLFTNIITKNTKIEGNISSDENLRIDGQVEGNIKIKGKIVLGKDSYIKGEISAFQVDISGKVLGSINCEDILVLNSTSNLCGDIFTKKLVIDSGAIFKGKCTIDENFNSLNEENK
jgi:cytoskeletal protein CcmA (bactofilin family)